MSPQELEELYKKVHSFTSACLDEVSALLNESGKWEDLAELLDVTSYMRCGLISPGPNISKNLLTFAVEVRFINLKVHLCCSFFMKCFAGGHFIMYYFRRITIPSGKSEIFWRTWTRFRRWRRWTGW